MGDKAVHTLFSINLNKVHPGHRLDMEKEGGDGSGGGELWGGDGGGGEMGTGRDVYTQDE